MGEQTIAFRAIVSRDTIAAGFIFNLHHDDAVLRIVIAQIFHELDESLSVGRQRLPSMGAQHIMVFALFRLHARKTLAV